MKKQVLFLLPCIALMACNGGGGKSGSAAQSADNAQVATEEPAKALFTYVEPKDDIAKIIWTKLLESDPGVKHIVDEAKTWQMDDGLGEYFNGASQKERYPQKTRMIFHNVVDGAEGSYDALAYFKMQCYQTNEGDWIAVLFTVTEGVVEDGPSRMANLSSLIYKDGELYDYSDKADLPAVQIQPITAYPNRDYSDCAIQFDTIGFTLISRDFWPIRYNWNGEKFVQDAESAVLASITDKYGKFGPFHIDYELKMNYSVAKDCQLENNVLTQNGEKMAEFEINDGKISAITIYSSKIGYAQKIKYTNDTYGSSYLEVVASKPLAVGFPIKNAFDKEDGAPEYTTGKKDGYYVMTRLTNRDKYNKRDIMISLYAKDENSNIEKIRLYAVPLKITLESELADNSRITDEVKSIWQKINEEYLITDEFGEFHNCNIQKNGFSANFYDKGKFTKKSVDNPIEWMFSCYMFKTLSGEYKIFTQKEIDNTYWVAENEKDGLCREFAEYTYANGKLTKTAVEIPQSVATDYKAAEYDKTLVPPGKELTSSSETLNSAIPIPDYSSGSSICLTETGFEFRASTPKFEYFCTEAESEGEDCWRGNYETYYDWDGENFISRSAKEAADKDLIIKLYAKVPTEDLHYDYKEISANDFATDYDYEGKKVSLRDCGFAHYWARTTKVLFIAQRTIDGYDVYYYTQTAPDAQPKFIKYIYKNETLSKSNISQSEIDSLKDEYPFVFN